MKYYSLIICALACYSTHAQQAAVKTATPSDNIYTIKKQYLDKVLHNPNDKSDHDNDLTRFNRWFHLTEPRCYPSGNLPRPDALITEYLKQKNTAHKTTKTTSGSGPGTTPWTSLGPNTALSGFGIGRVNCIVVDPVDTNTLYIGTACGGVWVSHNGGTSWISNSDNFPSLSIADIAVNPHHTDTLYAATGDGYGYTLPGLTGATDIFWGGLYSAGVMKSTDGGSTWTTTGLSYVMGDNIVIQKLLIHPNNPNILLAATTTGIYRSADAGTTWLSVASGHVYSMAFHPLQPDTVYAMNGNDLRVSYDAGLTWNLLYPAMGSSSDRCTIAVTRAAPAHVWVLTDMDDLYLSTDEGHTFATTPTSPSMTAGFYGYYDRVLAVSPTDPNFILACGMAMAVASDGGSSWTGFDVSFSVHPDNHAIAFNPLNSNTIFDGNDGGIFVTHDAGNTWTNISNGLTISQIYRMSSSRQNPGIMLCGLQDNASAYNDGTGWVLSNGPFGDGMDNAIHPLNDNIQIASTQYDNFEISYDQGATYNTMSIGGVGGWTTPVVFNPHSPDTIYIATDDVYASYDMGASFTNLSSSSLFPGAAVCLAIAPSSSAVIYASDYGSIYRTTDYGATWTNVTGSLPSSLVSITGIAVDYRNPMLVYATTSGYTAGTKVFVSTTGGTAWTNISTGIPNIPADCIAVDSSTPGALFAGTDMGVYYTDSATTGWVPYSTGLPNVIVDDIDINYTNYKIRVATYGRGVWEAGLPHVWEPNQVSSTPAAAHLQLYPNPTRNSWKVIFPKQKPAEFTVKVADVNGRKIATLHNADIIDASKLEEGIYFLEVTTGTDHYKLKAIKD